MAYFLYTGEMIEAIKRDDAELGAQYEELYAAVNKLVAMQLAAITGAGYRHDTELEDGRFGASFHPTFDGQTLPAELDGFDTEGEWGENSAGFDGVTFPGNTWVIWNPSDGTYWSNADGWTDQRTASHFNDELKAVVNLPMEGEWLQLKPVTS